MTLYEHELKNAYIGEYGWEPWSNTIAYYPLTANANDYSGNLRNWTATGVTYTTQDWVECAYSNWSSSTRISLPWFWTLTNFTFSIMFKTSVGQWWIVYIFPVSDVQNLWMYIGSDNSSVNRWNWTDSAVASFTKVSDWIWHNIIVTNGTNWVKVYVDWALSWSNSSARTVVSENGRTTLFSRHDGQWPQWWYLSNVIFEDWLWDATKCDEYWNTIKSKYWRI